jgi:hypothetical protein
MTVYPSPVNRGEGGGLGACSVAGGDGGSCDSGVAFVLAVVDEGSADDSASVGSLDESGTLPGGPDELSMFENVPAL